MAIDQAKEEVVRWPGCDPMVATTGLQGKEVHYADKRKKRASDW